jgi:hypothetical protein
MDKLTSLNLSFDKIVISVLIPGIIAIFPFFLLYLHFHPSAKDYFYLNQSITITTVTFISLIAGMILDNIGGRFEVGILDVRIKRKISDFDETWNKFLQLSYKDEPVGQRYLRNILLRMKFEISTGVALIPMTIGLLILNHFKPIFSSCIWTYLLLFTTPLLFSCYLLFIEAPSSAVILARTRKLLVDRFENQSKTD